MKCSFILFILFYIQPVFAQKVIIKSIKEFGAKGDGKSLDQNAFIKAAEFINKRKGDVLLTIPKGLYIIGNQTQVSKPTAFIEGQNTFVLTGCKNVTIRGENGAKIKYKDSLKFGTFNPKDGKILLPTMPFTDRSFVAEIGCAIQILDCENINLDNIDIDGNNTKMIVGGQWGDTGYQLWHYGIYISNSKKIAIKNCEMNYFALDGLCIINKGKEKDSITVETSTFNYNGRQGFSWIGGNGLIVTKCSFNNTGKAKIVSAPGCGVDFEAEGDNTIRNGVFNNCEFINNAANGIAADSGPCRDITFNNCTFWGVTGWSIWVAKPNFVFNKCNIYGSFVHGYITTEFKDATKFYYCNFEDKKYKGIVPYGRYLFESEGKKLMIFENCTFTATNKKIIWYSGAATQDSEKAIFKNCTVNNKNKNIEQNDFYAIMRKMRITNCTFNLYAPKIKNNYLGEETNIFEKNITNYIVEKSGNQKKHK